MTLGGDAPQAIVDVIVEDDRWHAVGIERIAAKAFHATLRQLGLDGAFWEISLLACDDAKISTLNADFRGKPQPTNVLSWPNAERAARVAGATPILPNAEDQMIDDELGDIAIAYETCAREAKEAGKTMQDHVTHLIVHGILHVLGYDHVRDADATLMEGLESRILGNMGIADPY